MKIFDTKKIFEDFSKESALYEFIIIYCSTLEKYKDGIILKRVETNDFMVIGDNDISAKIYFDRITRLIS